MASSASEDSDQEQSLSSLRSSTRVLDQDEGEPDNFEMKSPLEKHMVKLFTTSLSDISTISLVSDNARSTVSPQLEPSSRLLRPSLAKSLSDRNVFSQKFRPCRWSSESPTSNRPSYRHTSPRSKGTSPMADQMAADMSRWKNRAPSLPSRPVERLFLRQNSDSVLMRPERSGSSSSLSSTNSTTSFSDLEQEIPTPVPSREDL